MKILFYNHTGQVSGAEHLLMMILSRLDRERFEPVVVCPAEGPLAALTQGAGVRVETVAGLDARFTWRVDHLWRYLNSFYQTVSQVRRKVISIRPSLIHANSIRAGLVATVASWGLGTPVIWHLHDLLPPHPFSVAIRAFAYLSRSTRMIAVSQAVARNFCGAWPSLGQRVGVILNAIDRDKFQPAAEVRAEKRRELQLEETDFVVGIVGQITPRKGQLELLRAFVRMQVELPHAVLLIVGAPLFNRDQEYFDLLQQFAREMGLGDRVRLLGKRVDVAAIMQSLDLLVLNSSAEPFGLVAVEAMACGTAVLAASTGGLPEIIEHGKDGWLFVPGDEKGLLAELTNLGRQPQLRARLANEAKMKVARCFSSVRFMSELQHFYLESVASEPIELSGQAADISIQQAMIAGPRGQ